MFNSIVLEFQTCEQRVLVVQNLWSAQYVRNSKSALDIIDVSFRVH